MSLQNLVKLRQFHSVYKMTYTKCVNMLTVVVQSTVVQILNSNVISDYSLCRKFVIPMQKVSRLIK